MDFKMEKVSLPKVKIVAIAKDEAAYIPEWIHHHLYFGFDAIEIHINRTTDNSVEVLNEISSQYPSVTWEYADWIDMCPAQARQKIQFIVYAKALEEARREGTFSHVLFLDIDEFWCPQDFTTSINDCLLSLPTESAIFFEWINDLGDSPAFSRVPSVLNGNLSPLGKSSLPVNTKIAELRHHVSLFADDTPLILADGRRFEARERPNQAVEKHLNSVKKAFIYHRAHRSEVEYVSLLYRGRAGNDFNYKNNRTGLPKTDKFNSTVEFPLDSYELFQKSYEEFYSRLDLKELIETAEAFVLKRYQAAIDNMGASLHANYKDMMKIFCRVKVAEVTARFTYFRRKKIAQHPSNVNLIRDLAIDAASQNLDEAIDLMKMAHELRPKGPQIRKKLELLEQKKLALQER